MIVTHNVGILAANLKLTALSSLNGGVIYQDISWKITQVGADDPAEFESDKAQPIFSVAEGDYTIACVYQGKELDLGGVYLAQNTQTDMVFILNEFEGGVEDDYFAEFDVEKDIYRRQHERDIQSELHGSADGPLREPKTDMNGELGSQIMAHPLLKDSAQFDGVPPEFSVQPERNEEAARLTLEKQLQNQHQPGATSSPSPNPMG